MLHKTLSQLELELNPSLKTLENSVEESLTLQEWAKKKLIRVIDRKLLKDMENVAELQEHLLQIEEYLTASINITEGVVFDLCVLRG